MNKLVLYFAILNFSFFYPMVVKKPNVLQVLDAIGQLTNESDIVSAKETLSGDLSLFENQCTKWFGKNFVMHEKFFQVSKQCKKLLKNESFISLFHTLRFIRACIEYALGNVAQVDLIAQQIRWDHRFDNDKQKKIFLTFSQSEVFDPLDRFRFLQDLGEKALASPEEWVDFLTKQAHICQEFGDTKGSKHIVEDIEKLKMQVLIGEPEGRDE